MQELLQHLDRKVRGYNIIFKFDMMKAFDFVRWDFLSSLLLKFGFAPRFISLIINNLRSSWFSVVVNGKSAGVFQATRGLKQGDPLSPYLYILVSEALSRGLRALILQGTIQPFSLPRHACLISHLLFADDLIIFTNGSRTSLSRFYEFLSLYEETSGLCINKSKSAFYVSKRCPHNHLRRIELVSGISQGGFPFRYLGCWLYKGRKRILFFFPAPPRFG